MLPQDELDELSYFDDEDFRDFRPRKHYRCSDRMCGATDCWNCFPTQQEESEEE
jgi:hypothetical protein